MRSIISRSTATTSSLITQVRTVAGGYNPVGTTHIQKSAHKNVAGSYTAPASAGWGANADEGAAAVTASLKATGASWNNTFDSVEDMFTPSAYLQKEAKFSRFTSKAHSGKYVVPKAKEGMDADAVQVAIDAFTRFAKDTDQVELFYRKFIRNFPATVHLVGSAAEIAAFEATEAAKIPNNKLIVGRVNSKAGVQYTNIRDEMFFFFTQLVYMGTKSEEEIKAFAVPYVTKFLNESFVSPHFYWDYQEEVVRSLSALPVEPATRNEIRIFTEVTERSVKAVLNALADMPWSSESATCPTRGLNFTGFRPAAEAGMW